MLAKIGRGLAKFAGLACVESCTVRSYPVVRIAAGGRGSPDLVSAITRDSLDGFSRILCRLGWVSPPRAARSRAGSAAERKIVFDRGRIRWVLNQFQKFLLYTIDETFDA